MENIVIALNAVLPLFAVIGLGVLARRLRILSDESARQANGLCFKLFMAPLLFCSVYNADLRAAFDPRLILFCILGTVCEFLVGLVVLSRAVSDRAARGVMLQSFCRPNLILLGLPMSVSLFGEDSVGAISVLLAVMVPLINILAVLSLELFHGSRPSPRRILLGVVKNPFVLGAAAGLLCQLLQIRLPYILDTVVTDMADAATPLALVLMGTSMNFGRLQGAARYLAICTLARLLVFPAVFISLGAALGFRGVTLCAVMLVFATPVAVNSYTMALQMDADADLAGGIVLLTTSLSCLTLFLWILALKTLGLF